MPAIPVIMAIGAVVSAGAATASAVQQKQAADYNAKMAQQTALAKETQTNENIRRSRMQNQQILGAQRVAGATSGSAMSGSLLTAYGANAGILEGHVADLATQGTSEKMALLNQAKLYNMQGNAALVGGIGQAAGTLLSSAGDVYGAYKKYGE